MFHGLTIDPPGTRDRDDAISVARVGDAIIAQVAFPDLTGLILQGDDLDRAAAEIGTTIYGREGIAKAMLPWRITEQGSLDPGPPSAVFVVRIRLDHNGRILATDLRRDVFASRGCHTYAEASRIIRSPDSGEIGLASQVAQTLYQRRVADGALVHYDLQRGLITNEEGAVRQVEVAGVRAEVLIAEFMILANRCLAEIAAREGLPILYRNHRARPAASRSDLAADLAHGDPQILARQDMVLEHATIEPVSVSHYGLNLPGYAWFTSPLRRYADLLNQRALGRWLDGEPADATDLDAIGRHLTDLAHRQARQKSDYLKNQDRHQHTALLSSDLSGVSLAALSKVIEIARQTATIPPSLRTTILARLPNGGFDIATLFDVMRLSPDLATAALAELATRPHDAMSVLSHARHLLGWDEPTFTETRVDHGGAMVFTLTGHLTVDGTPHTAPPAQASSIKAARARAMISLFAEIFDADHPAVPDVVLPPKPIPAKPKGKAVTPPKARPTAVVNGKGPLNELCQQQHWAVPVYTTDHAGPDHARVFTGRVVVDTGRGRLTSRPATGETRKEAEHAAAVAWMNEHGRTR